MRPESRTLGWLVIAYALLHAIYLPQVVALFLSLLIRRRLPGTWYEGSASLAWLAFLIGGIGLLRGRTWGRWMVVAASAAWIASALFALPPVLRLGESVLAGTVVIGIAVEALFLAGALRVRFPAASEAPAAAPLRALPPERQRLDKAYGLFGIVALTILAYGVVTLIPMDFTTAQGLGMLVGFPVFLILLVAAITALVHSVRLFREWPLPVMSGLLITIPIALAAWDETIPGRNARVSGWIIIAVAAMVLFCVRWFAFLRRRHVQVPGDS